MTNMRSKFKALDVIFNEANISEDLLKKANDESAFGDLNSQQRHQVKQLVQNAKEYYENLVSQLPNYKQMAADQIVMILPMLIPDVELEKIKNKLDILLRPDWFAGIPGRTTIQGEDKDTVDSYSANIITLLYSAVNVKFDIKNNKRKSLHEELEDWNQQISNAISVSERKQVAAEVKSLSKAVGIISEYEKSARAKFDKERESLFRAMQPTARYERFLLDRKLLNDIISISQEYIKQARVGNKFLTDLLNELNLEYGELGLLEENSPEWIAKLHACELIRDKLFSTIIITIEKKISSLVSTNENEDVIKKHTALLGDLSALGTPTDLKNYTLLVNKFQQAYLNLIQDVQTADREYREKLKTANQIILQRFPQNNYKYLLTGSDLRNSKSEYVISQTANSQENFIYKTINRSKFLFREQGDNFDQLKKDLERELRLAGKTIKDLISEEKIAKEYTEEELRHYVKNVFANDADSLIQNSHQRFSYMLSNSLAANSIQSNGSMMDQAILFLQPENIYQNIYVENGITFREAYVTSKRSTEENTGVISFYVMNDSENSMWKFKTNFKIIGWLSKDGFESQLGTDSALIANVLMQQKGYPYLSLMVNAVLDTEKELNFLLSDLNNQLAQSTEGKEASRRKKLLSDKNVIEDGLSHVKLFKEGNITFDELAITLRMFANGIKNPEESESLRPKTKTFSFFNLSKPSKTAAQPTNVMFDFFNRTVQIIEKAKEKLDLEANLITGKMQNLQELLASLKSTLSSDITYFSSIHNTKIIPTLDKINFVVDIFINKNLTRNDLQDLEAELALAVREMNKFQNSKEVSIEEKSDYQRTMDSLNAIRDQLSTIKKTLTIDDKESKLEIAETKEIPQRPRR